MNIVFLVYRDHENSIRYLGEGSIIEEWGETCKGEIRRGAEETEKQRKKQTISWCLWLSSLSLNLWNSGLS